MTARATQLMLAIAAVIFVAVPANLPAAGSTDTVDIRIDPRELSWERSGSGVGARLEGAAPANAPGAFDLPLLPITVVPPLGSRLAGIEVLDLETAVVAPPAPVRRVPGETRGNAPVVDLAAGQLAIRAPGGYLRGQRLDAVVLSPVRREADGSWRLVTRIRLGLRFEVDSEDEVARPLRGPVGIPPGHLPGRVIDLSGQAHGAIEGRSAISVASTEAGGEPYDPRFSPSLDGSPVAYVIITNQAMAGEFQRLADWHTREGEPSVVRTVEWIAGAYTGVDLQQKIRAFIRDAVVHWGTEWVVLGGDTPVIPVRYGFTTYVYRAGSEIPTDLYYQCLDGNWNANGNVRVRRGGRHPAQPDGRRRPAPGRVVGPHVRLRSRGGAGPG